MIRAALLVSALLLMSSAWHIEAQSPTTITLPSETPGTLDSGVTASYTFNATAGGVVSLSVRAEGDFDPVLTLLDNSGRIVLSNDDYAYPDSRDALLEAITIPYTGTYTVQVSGFDGSAGDYTLRAYPGYSEIAADVQFSQSGGWERLDDLTAVSSADGLTGSLTGTRVYGAAMYQFADPAADAYVQAHFTEIDNPSGWAVGLALRQSTDGYYALIINDEGLWRFGIVSGGALTVLRDWTPHPNIVAGQTEFTLGAIANGVGFDFFYNGGYIGSFTDSTLSRPGSSGVVVGAIASLSSTTRAVIDHFVVTTPHFVSGERLIPQQLIVTSSAEMERALELRHVVSAAGSMALTVPESSVQYARDGINRLMLGRGTTYHQFALGAMVEVQGARSGLAGCGLMVSHVSDTDYVLAFLDQTGGYGLSQRLGDEFLPGVFGENTAYAGGTHQLLVIADAAQMYYYIDGTLTGSLPFTVRAGEIGTAVVNYETITTNCQFRDIWLWSWG